MIKSDPEITFRNLAPGIHRQRIVAEWRRLTPVTAAEIREFSPLLAAALRMNVIDLSVSWAEPYGYGAGCHWDYSGWSLMGWDKPEHDGMHPWSTLPFATLDLHSCLPYEYATVAEAVRMFWEPVTDAADGELLSLSPVLPELAAR